VAAVVRDIIAELTPARVEVVGDMVIALEAAFGSGPGVIAISGTGSIVYGRDAAGQTARAGGWGFAVSDEGSGQWIGRRAVSVILRAHDEGHESALADAIHRLWHVTTLDEVIQVANSSPPPEFPRLLPLVLLQPAASAEELPLLSARPLLLRRSAAFQLRRHLCLSL